MQGKSLFQVPADGFSGVSNETLSHEVAIEKMEGKHKKACAFKGASFFIL
ncbi:hypothetical protein [Bacillus paralicheniformis]|nr:hypothetical protein [Bacillus paralicheniformis]